MDAHTPDKDFPSTEGNNHATAHTEELSKLITMLGRATNLMGRARNVVDLGQHALPQVQEKLSSISSANEEAAMSIMNETETIAALSDAIQRQLESAKIAVSDLNALVRSSQTDEVYNTTAAVRGYVDQLTTAVCEHELGFVQSLQVVISAIDEVRRAAMSIAMTLQVQDITAQQLAGAGQMVENVQSNLTTMFAPHAPEAVQTQPKTSEAFNPDAKFERTENRQSAVDDLFNQIHKTMEG